MTPQQSTQQIPADDDAPAAQLPPYDGIRLAETDLQLRGEAPEDRTISSISGDRNLALTHNLGGYPGEMVAMVSIWGNQLG